MRGGYFNKLLWVDLSKGSVWEEELADKDCEDYLGGYGLGAKVLFERQKPGLAKFAAENILGFVAGPLVGTPAITGCRLTVVGKSPLTGTWGDSNCGGHFAPALKKTGYDGVFVSGIADAPVYLWMEDGKAELRPAEHLWGMSATEAEETLKSELGKGTQVVSIGEPGERKNLIAAIMHDGGRAAGRSGLGALMGSKNLKAVAVRGNKEVPMYDENKAKEIRAQYVKNYKEDPNLAHFTKYGTIDHVASSAFSNDSPVKNWIGVGVTDFPTADQISDDAILEYEVKKYACWRCPIACGGYYDVKSGPYEITGAHKPEYETSGMIGNNLLNDNLESIILANELCNRHGFDTIAVGAAIAFAMECFEKGYLSTEDTGGLDLRWGNHEAIIEVIKLMVKGEGIGALLANGAKAASDQVGEKTSEFVVHVNGQDLPAHDPRFAPSWGLYYKVDATPGRHTQLGLVPYELGKGYPGLDLGAEIQRYVEKGKGVYTVKVQNIMHALYSTGICLFAIQRTNINAWLDFINAVCGTEMTLADFEAIGSRIAALRQAFNIREGLEVASFELSGRAWSQPLPGGPLEGVTLDLPTMVSEYYEAQGWDERGWPSEERLQKLGLGWVADTLYKDSE